MEIGALMQLVAIIVSVLVTAVAVPMITLATAKFVRVLKAGQPVIGRRDQPVKRTLTMFKETFLHTRMTQGQFTVVGVMHWFVYAAFLVLSTAVLQAYFQLADPEFAWPIIGHFFLYEWIAEGLGLLSTIGIIYLIAVRQRNHPRRLERGSRFYGSTFWQAYFVEIMALLEGAAILFVRGAEYKLFELTGDTDKGGRFHFPFSGYVGDALYGSAGEDGLKNIIFFVAMFKIVLAMVWLIVIARNITMGVAWHRFTAWFNIWFKRESDGGTALGGLVPLYVGGEPIDLEKLEDLDEDDFNKLGVGKVEDFSWKGLLDFSTCTECGRCQSQCPAWNTEKPLSPKLLMLGLREHAHAKLPLLDIPEDQRTEAQVAELERPLIGDADVYGVIDPDVLWSCTNCGACVQQCPVDIEHVDHIDNMRRYQVLVESNFPAELNNIFKGLERKGNPWNMSPKDRLKWTDGLDFEVKQVGVDVEDLDEVEWLFWVGCAGAYEDRAKKTTQAVAELLDMAGVTFAVLGDGETCTGDAARRSGNEIVFQQLAMQNVETFKETKVKKVVSTCAHCFNTLKNEYQEFGIELEVVHHTQLLNRLVREKKLTPVAASEGTVAGTNITYHDPCFLGRHNQVYEAPRELLEIIPGATFTEMPRNKETSFCCGAGGARMWMEETIGSRINVNRTVEAVATGADKIATGCPFCRVMLSDGLTLKQSEGEAREEVEVIDVAQMLLAAVKRAPAPEEEAEVIAEAEAATAAAATDKAGDGSGDDSGDGDSGEDAEKGTEAAADVVEEEKLDDPATTTEDEATDHAAAKQGVPVDEKGSGSTDESDFAEEPRNADAREGEDSEAETLEQSEGEPGDRAGDSGVVEDEADAAEADDETTTSEPAGDEAKAEATSEDSEADDREASEKEEGAWANVGAVNTDLLPGTPAAGAEPTDEADAKPADDVEEPEAEPEPGDTTDPDAESAPSAQPDTESSPSEDTPAPEADEPVEEGAREEEAETLDDKAEAAEPEAGSISPDAPEGIVSVEEGSDPEVESDDVAPLTEANPSGADLSSAATEMAADDEDDADEAKKTD
ncbi:heterodisulfide reductase-related iron-sulfur binding cluster [Aeromicrobium sp. Sec7.5]|uniref:heterodisulfide reductase-related iron-sulfur binding cluster n=1 Tax=Aeromicrobium sp. Sec7.5 TaxID=3121276 RepID=UPI002FE45C43